MTYPTANTVNTVATGGTSTNVFIYVFQTRDPTIYDIQYPVQKKWLNTTNGKEYILTGYSTLNGVTAANWLLVGSQTAVEKLVGNTGGAVSPNTSNEISVLGDTTTINIVGNPTTHELTANVILPATSNSVLLGQTSSISAVAAGAVGEYLQCQGPGVDPIWSLVDLTTSVTNTLPVDNGGTGSTSFAINGPVISGATGTTALTAITLANQQILAGNTASAPTAKSIQIIETVYTSGVNTHTFASGLLYAFVQLQAAGGGGGGCAANPGNDCSNGGGGGAGGYTQKLFTAAQVGASQVVTIGANGTAGANTGGNGGNASASSFGALLVCAGGSGGTGGASSPNFYASPGGLGGTATTPGTYAQTGQSGSPGASFHASSNKDYAYGGAGGSNVYGFGGQSVFGNSSANNGTNGGGGSGSSGQGSGGGGLAGGVGGLGYCIITEYILA